jgi:crotonobetainyl-CoA:carnitine CoA-transferase CaiB-like acyl-CoA transferase
MNMKEVAEDPQVRHLGMLVEMTHPRMGPVRLVGSGIRMSETPPRIKTAPPVLGEHTEDILAALGYDDASRQTLCELGVI